MRPLAVLPLLGLLAGCAPWPSFETPPTQAKVDRLWKARDICLLTNTPQFDDHVSDPRKIARFIAMSCVNETSKLLDAAIPEPDAKAKLAFQQEAERRAATIVLDFRRVDAATDQHRRTGQPTPLQE
jgi:hypothetical protein